MKNILLNTDNACSTYVQGNELCNKCIRNIGFYSDSHITWENYKLLNNSCVGFIEKTTSVKPITNLNHWLS